MIEPADENDKRRAKANYLHFEDEDPKVCDVYFDSFDEALEFINNCNWSFATEDWEPAGLFEAKIDCKDRHGAIVGQLLKLTIKIPEQS